MAEVNIVGNVGKDPELRFTKSGKAVCSFSVAVNRKRGEETESHWVDVTCWSSLAENVAESIAKGTRVMVMGNVDQQTWENDAGEKRSKLQVIAWNVGPDLSYATAVIAKNERRDD